MSFEGLLFFAFCLCIICLCMCYIGYLNYLLDKEEIRQHYLDPNNQEE